MDAIFFLKKNLFFFFVILFLFSLSFSPFINRGHLCTPLLLHSSQWCRLHILSVLHSGAPAFPAGELLHTSGAPVFFISGDPVFVAASQGMPLDCLTLEAREAYIPGSHGTVTIKEIILGRL